MTRQWNGILSVTLVILENTFFFSHVEYIDQCKQLMVTAVLNLSSTISQLCGQGRVTYPPEP